MIKQLRPLAIALVPVLLVASACGSDDSSGDSSGGSDSTEAADDASDSQDTAAADDSGSADGNPDVEAYCDEVEEFVEAMNAVLADPTSGDAAALATQGLELTNKAAKLAGSAGAGDSDRLAECSKKVEEIGS
jgi:hypothetical protein